MRYKLVDEKPKTFVLVFETNEVFPPIYFARSMGKVNFAGVPFFSQEPRVEGR